VQTAQGKSLALACKEAEISEQSYYRWRKEYGGLQVDQARKMKDLERENARLDRDEHAGELTDEPRIENKFPEATSASTCFSKDR
jgi:putative transposase